MEKKEYIDRNAVLTVIQTIFHETDPVGEEQIGILKAHRIVREAPAADVAPVVHGQWVCVSDDDRYEGEYWCSVCNAEEFLLENAPFPPYCWKCGAKMDGGKIMNETNDMGMKLAVLMFCDINNEKISDSDKGMAIYKVMNMPTRMSITKDQMIEVIKYLWNQLYEVIDMGEQK